jgi:hypothetical protein
MGYKGSQIRKLFSLDTTCINYKFVNKTGEMCYHIYIHLPKYVIIF